MPEIEALDGQDQVDPWEAAFAALDQENQKDTETAAGESGGTDGDPHSTHAGQSPVDIEAADSQEDAGPVGGPGDVGTGDGDEDEAADLSSLGITEEEIDEYRNDFIADIRQRTIDDVAEAYIKQGVRNQNGKLGATIDDPDICKRDSDGVPHFFNPETGREFTGDNPRKQAQEWVDYYNQELSKAFNQTCSDYAGKLAEEESSSFQVLEFAPKYVKLDSMRQAMFDSIIEDYEIEDDDGNVIGYSCDLDRALAAVNRQVATIQDRFKGYEKPAPSGPALDMPGSGNRNPTDTARPQFKSIEEAMEWEQDQLLAKMRERK